MKNLVLLMKGFSGWIVLNNESACFHKARGEIIKKGDDLKLWLKRCYFDDADEELRNI